jgi:hypothetical protein
VFLDSLYIVPLGDRFRNHKTFFPGNRNRLMKQRPGRPVNPLSGLERMLHIFRPKV